MLEQDAGDDYVLATGHAMTMREFSAAAFGRVGLDWERHLRLDARHERPSEVAALIGDPPNARTLPVGKLRPAALTWPPHGRRRRGPLDDERARRPVRIDC